MWSDWILTLWGSFQLKTRAYCKSACTKLCKAYWKNISELLGWKRGCITTIFFSLYVQLLTFSSMHWYFFFLHANCYPIQWKFLMRAANRTQLYMNRYWQGEGWFVILCAYMWIYKLLLLSQQQTLVLYAELLQFKNITVKSRGTTVVHVWDSKLYFNEVTVKTLVCLLSWSALLPRDFFLFLIFTRHKLANHQHINRTIIW